MLTPTLSRIHQRPSVVNPASSLSGAYLVWDVPQGPVAGAYQTMRGTAEDLAAYLLAQNLIGGTGTGLATAAFAATAPGAQAIPQANATWFGDVGLATANGKSIPLSYGSGYQFSAGQLLIDAAAGVVAGDVITYTYASGAVSGQQPAPVYTAGRGIALSATNVLSTAAALLVSAYDDAFNSTYAIAASYLNTALTIGVGAGSTANIAVTLPPVTLADVSKLLRIACEQGPSGNIVYTLTVPGLRRPLRHSEYALLAVLEEPAIAPNPNTGDPGRPAQAGWVVLSEPGYTDQQARAAVLNRTSTATTVRLTSEAATDYGTAASGTFTVDATGCVVGKEAYFGIGAGGSAPVFTNAPTGQPYKFIGAVYGAGLAFSYSLRVRVDRIEVVILAD